RRRHTRFSRDWSSDVCSSDLDEVQPQFYPVLNNLAQTLREYDQTIIEVAGHTDNVGSAAYNQGLSERRAQSVANYLAGQGINQQIGRASCRGSWERRLCGGCG